MSKPTNQNPHPAVELVSFDQFANLLHVNGRTLRRMIARGETPAHVRFTSGARFWRPETITRWFAARETLDGNTTPARTRRAAGGK
jgi:hypothetical protein